MNGWPVLAVKARLWLRVAWLALACGGAGGAWPKLQRLTSMLRRPRGGERIRRCARVRSGYAWDLHLPYFPSPAFDRLVRSELERIEEGADRLPHVAIVAITRQCGLRCKHCFEWSVRNQSEALSPEELRHSLTALLQLGVTQFFFSGWRASGATR